MSADGAAKGEKPLEDLLDEAIEEADGDELTVGGLIDHFGTRGFGPVIATLALLVLTVGAIPFLPVVIAIIILLMSVQLLFGKKSPWLPGFIRDRGIHSDRLEKAREKSGKWLARVDKLIKPRLKWASGKTAQWFAALCITGLAVVMSAPPLEAIPFAVDVPNLPILLFGLGLTARDGLLMLLGFAASAVAAYLSWTWLMQPEGNGESALLLISMVA
ncbi:MAG: exopolysaccharide biosynthesis protein [Pacificimonas sp.]